MVVRRDCKQDKMQDAMTNTRDGRRLDGQASAAEQSACARIACRAGMRMGEDTHGVVDFKSEAERDGETETTCTGTRTVGEPSVRGEGTLLRLP